jgi:AraC-like DNA-binding protein
VRLDESGVPPSAFAQLLDSGAFGDDAEAAFRRIMAREGISVTTLIKRDMQVPLRWFREVYPRLDREQGFRLGAAFAEHAQLTSFGPLSLPLVSAGSVVEVVELLAFLPLISTALSPQFHHTEQGLTIGLAGRTGDEGMDCFAITYGGLAVLRLVDMLAGVVPTVELHLGFPGPIAGNADEDVLAKRLVFDAPASFVFVPADVLDEVCQFSDPVSYRLAIADLQKAVDRRHTVSYADRVRDLFESNPTRTNSSWAARELSVSTSTLKRRLGAEGTTFRQLRQAFVQERATFRLLDPSLTVSEIATELGYTDVASFSHAFTRWTGRSPREFRRTVSAALEN